MGDRCRNSKDSTLEFECSPFPTHRKYSLHSGRLPDPPGSLCRKDQLEMLSLSYPQVLFQLLQRSIKLYILKGFYVIGNGHINPMTLPSS